MSRTVFVHSPDQFRQWTAISLLGAAAQRRIWSKTGGKQTFPNLFILLVAPPGVGKQIIQEGADLVSRLEKDIVILAPHSMTKAALLDQLSESKCRVIPKGAPAQEHLTLYVMAEEFGVFLPEYDGQFLSVLNEIWNNPPVHRERLRYRKPPELVLPFPQLNLIGGIQPGFMAQTFPDVAWQTGTMSRTILVYIEDLEIRDIFAEPEPGADDQRELIRHLTMIARHYGEMIWHDQAKATIKAWHLADGPPKPTHTKLNYYSNRRTQFLSKLSMISALSRGSFDLIEPIDLERGKHWLLTNEEKMPDIFRAMTGKNDLAIVEELHLYLVKMTSINGRKGVSEDDVYRFIMQYVTGEKVQKIVELAERAGYVSRAAGQTNFMPKVRLMKPGMI